MTDFTTGDIRSKRRQRRARRQSADAVKPEVNGHLRPRANGESGTRAEDLRPRQAAEIDPRFAGFFDFEFLRGQNGAFANMADTEVFELLMDPDWEAVAAATGSTPRPNPLFDPSIYRNVNTDVASGNPIAHYLESGIEEGRVFHPLISLEYLSSQCSIDFSKPGFFAELLALMRQKKITGHPLIDPDYIASQLPHIDPKEAYLAVLTGSVEPPTSPHPLFNVLCYADRRGVAFISVAEALLDFLAEPDRPVPIFLFDRDFYAAQTEVPDGWDPYIYFIHTNALDRDPTHPAMDVNFYIDQLRARNLACDVHPLPHFILSGQRLGLSLVRAFDSDFYIDQTGDRDRPIESYFVSGYRRHSPNPAIDLDFVAAHNQDFHLGETEVLGWIYSKAPSVRPTTHSRFDPAAYLEFYADIRNANLCPVAHFLEWGMREDRKPSRFFSHEYVRHALPKTLVTRSAVRAYLRSDLWKRPRLIFVSHDATLTGAPAIILRLLEDFSASGCFECFTLFDAEGARLPYFREASHTHVLEKSARKFGSEAKEPADEVRALIEPLFENRPIAAFVNSAESRHIGRAIARAGIPVVTLLHEVASFYPAETFSEIYGWSDRVVLPSDYVRKEANRLSADPDAKVVVRGQGLLKDSFGQLDRNLVRPVVCEALDIPLDARIVLSCGTMDLRKGLDYFVASAREYLTREIEDRPTYFVWIGDGARWSNSPYYFAIEEARIYGIENRIKLIGPRVNVEPYFVASDAFLMTARADPFPCVIHEAMACGLPIVGFEHAGGAPELYGHLGRTVRYGDVTAMAVALREVLEQDARRDAMGEAARAHILSEWRSQAYFQFFVEELDRLIGSDYASDARPRPFRRPVATVLRQGILDGRGEYLRRIHRQMAEAGIDCALLRTSFASEHDARFSQVVADTDEETFSNLVAVPGRSIGDLVRQKDAVGGGLLVLDVSMLQKLAGAVFTPRVALAVLVTSPTVEMDDLATFAAAVQLVLVPNATVAKSIETNMPILAGKCHVVELPGPAAQSPFSGRVLISALDPLVSPLDAIRRSAPLISAVHHRQPGLQTAILCPDREANGLRAFAADNFALRGYEVIPIAGGRDLLSAIGPGDIFLSMADLDTMPVGILAALDRGACPVVLGRLRWLRQLLNDKGAGLAFEASEIQQVRARLEAFVSGDLAPRAPDAAPPPSDYLKAVSELLHHCGQGSVRRTLRGSYLH